MRTIYLLMLLSVAACAAPAGQQGSTNITPSFEGAIPVDGFIKFN